MIKIIGYFWLFILVAAIAGFIWLGIMDVPVKQQDVIIEIPATEVLK